MAYGRLAAINTGLRILTPMRKPCVASGIPVRCRYYHALRCNRADAGAHPALVLVNPVDRHHLTKDAVLSVFRA